MTELETVDELVPSDLGFPAHKFSSYRPNQVETALDIAASDKRFNLLCMPTGGGKSLCAVTIARVLSARTLILVGTRGLQEQISRDFQELGLVDIRGQSNYKCVAVTRGGELEGYGDYNTTCAEGPCKADIKCSLKRGGCTYYDTVRAASKASIVITNYSYWLTIGRHADPMAIGKFDLLICDEAHSLTRVLPDHCAVELDAGEVQALLGMKLPPMDESMSVWSSWAKEAAIIAGDRYQAAKNDLELAVWVTEKRKLTKRLLSLQSLRRDLDEIALSHSWRNSEGPGTDIRMPGMQIDWVLQPLPHGVKFTPVWAHPYAEKYLFRDIQKVVLSSATLTPDINKYLGINPEDSSWHEAPSTFDPARSPVIYIPVTRVDKNMVDAQVRMWANTIDRIIEGRLDRKGIVHTVSYLRAQQLMELSKYKHLMMGHSSRDMRSVVEQFVRAEAPAVLVSPAVTEGYNFPFDAARYQVIAKLPFTDGRDPVEKARRKSDKGWANYTTSLAIVQMAGRIMRDERDFGETFLVDMHWGWFRRAVKWPGWFRAMWKQMRFVPPAPKLEEMKG